MFMVEKLNSGDSSDAFLQAGIEWIVFREPLVASDES